MLLVLSDGVSSSHRCGLGHYSSCETGHIRVSECESYGTPSFLHLPRSAYRLPLPCCDQIIRFNATKDASTCVNARTAKKKSNPDCYIVDIHIICDYESE